MTICVSGIAQAEDDEEEVIVVATDKMITLEDLGSFEHPIRKFQQLDEDRGLMLSGKPVLFKEILDDIDIEGESHKEACNSIREAMEDIKDRKLKRQLLDPLGISPDDKGAVLMQEPANQWLQKIQENLATHSLETQLLLVGYEDDEAQISLITESNVTHMRDINYAVIGSGSTQAINALLFQEHSKDTAVDTALYNVFKAKKNAEAHKGVGNRTDLFVLYQDEGVRKIEDEDINKLNDIYEKELEYGKTHEKLKDLNTARER